MSYTTDSFFVQDFQLTFFNLVIKKIIHNKHVFNDKNRD